MAELIHGGDLYGYELPMLDFSSNINPLGLPGGVKSALAASVGDWDAYPDPLCRALVTAIAHRESVAEQYVNCGNGAAELIFRVVQAKQPKRALLTAPAFAEYERALCAVHCEISFHTLYEKDCFALTEPFLKKLSPALDMVILCNPNNPTGQTIEQELLERIVKRCAEYNITLVVDECFNPFLENPDAHTLKGFLKACPHVILLKAFTKIYAMAGLRLGYLLCSDEKLMDALEVCEAPWSVSAPAQTAGLAALEDESYRIQTSKVIAQERAYLTEVLKKQGFTVIGSQANYIFFKCHSRTDLKDKLIPHGILIRSCGNYRGLDARFYRVAVKDHTANERLAAALAQISAQEG